MWDKDDKDCMDFVTACANIRAHIFGISQKTRFDIKCEYCIVFRKDCPWYVWYIEYCTSILYTPMLILDSVCVSP